MLDNIIIIAPLFSIMLLGFLLGKTKVFPEGSGAAKSLSTFVWYVAIPALLFKLLASKNFPSAEEFHLVLAYYFVLFIVYFVSAYLIAPRLNYGQSGYGIFAFSCTFGNMGFIGISLIQGLYGEDGLRILLMLISFHMVTLLPVTTFITEAGRQGTGKSLQLFLSAIIKSIKNPIVISLIISLAWAAGPTKLSLRLVWGHRVWCFIAGNKDSGVSFCGSSPGSTICCRTYLIPG